MRKRRRARGRIQTRRKRKDIRVNPTVHDIY